MEALKLYFEAAPADLTALLRRLMGEELLSGFQLVGGTALALRLGHRVSVDIVMFSEVSFDEAPVTGLLREAYSIQELESAKNTVRGVVGAIKVDLMSHQYPTIGNSIVADGIRIASLEDIAAMKLNAIANRGSKKDFWDYAELLNLFSRDDMLAFFAKKYTDENVWYVEKSLSYFEDAEAEPSPRCLRGRTWESVKSAVLESNRL